MTPPDGPIPPEDRSRRRFAVRLSVALGALLGAVVAAGPVAVLLDPLLRRRRAAAGAAEGWTPVAPVGRFEAGGPPARVVLKEDRTDAWLSRPDTPVGPVLVQRLDEATFRVFSGICPHLGCSVGFGTAARPYLCPCHRSSFAADGAVLAHESGESNPAPRGLDTLEWRVQGDVLQVRWVRYQTGVADKVPIA